VTTGVTEPYQEGHTAQLSLSMKVVAARFVSAIPGRMTDGLQR
jgi:hypothetical protein